MVRVNGPDRTFTNAQISGFYFRPCRDEYDEVILELFRCRCGTVRKQTNRNGYSNLMQQVLRQHPDHEAVVLNATTAETGSLISFVRHSSQNLYAWLEWVVESNLPLSFCEDRVARRYTNLEPISTESLCAGMEGVMQAVERKISAELPNRFGIIFDGWSHASEHYVAWFGCYEKNGVLVTPLLSMAPLMNELDDDLSARTHLEFLASMLPRDYGVQVDQCRFLVEDNCSVNRLFGALLGVPVVGCASALLNRAVQQDMAQHEEDLAAVQALMIKLRTLTQSAKLRLKTEHRPVIRQDTRWSSIFTMVQRYLKLQEFLDVEDDDIMEVMPTPAATKRFRTLFKELKDIESVSKSLQGSDVDLLDMRQWFDELIAVKPHYNAYLGPRANIVHSPDFEAGCVRVLRGRQDRLTRAEKAALLPFAMAVDNEDSTDDEGLSFVERIRKRRRLEQSKVTYEQLKSIPPTSNVVERFFSAARVTLGQQRHGLLPSTLEMILFLRENRSYWDASTVDSLN